MARVASIDSRSERTRSQLIEAAESLIAEHGVEGVSMRQIGLAAGAANPNVVGYHFGSKEALVAAVILHRLPQIEADRRQQLVQLGRPLEELPVAELVRVLYRPLVDAPYFGRTDEYPRFLSAAARSGFIAIWGETGSQFDVTLSIIEAIRGRLGLSGDVMSLRLRAVPYLASAMLDYLREFAITDVTRQGRLRQECLDQIVAIFCRNPPTGTVEHER